MVNIVDGGFQSSTLGPDIFPVTLKIVRDCPCILPSKSTITEDNTGHRDVIVKNRAMEKKKTATMWRKWIELAEDHGEHVVAQWNAL